MLLTATTTSQKLIDMFTSADLDLIKKRCGSCHPDGRYLVYLQVTGSYDVYVDFYKTATSANGAKVNATNGEIAFSLSDLQDARLISVTGNSEIRALINK